MKKEGSASSGGDCSTEAVRWMLANPISECRSGLLIGTTSFIQKLCGCDKQTAFFRHLCWNSSDSRPYGDLCNTRGYVSHLLAISSPFGPCPLGGFPSRGLLEEESLPMFQEQFHLNPSGRSTQIPMVPLLLMEPSSESEESEERLHQYFCEGTGTQTDSSKARLTLPLDMTLTRTAGTDSLGGHCNQWIPSFWSYWGPWEPMAGTKTLLRSLIALSPLISQFHRCTRKKSQNWFHRY